MAKNRVVLDLESKLKASLKQMGISKFIIAANKRDLKEHRVRARELTHVLKVLKKNQK